MIVHTALVVNSNARYFLTLLADELSSLQKTFPESTIEVQYASTVNFYSALLIVRNWERK